MKQIAKYRCLVIAGKLTMDVRITIDDRSAEYTSMFDGNTSTSLTLFPIVTISLTKPAETDENGNRMRAVWNPNDNLSMTKFNLPVFYSELHEIFQDMKTPNLYTYHGKRLEINEEEASKIRRVFMIGNMTLELSAVVVIKQDETRVEGIKMKFNNEQSSVLLTINEVTSLLYNIDHLDVDNLAFQMYLNYVKKPSKGVTVPNTPVINQNLPKVDIKPKDDFSSEEF